MTPSFETSKVELRAATTADVASITRLLNSAKLPTIGVGGERLRFIVAEAGGALVGVVGTEQCGDRYALLRSAAVTEGFRGRGIGRLLVERAIGEARASGIEALYLLTTTAEHYFPTFGFSNVERIVVPEAVKATDEFVSACPASATVMKLSLD